MVNSETHLFSVLWGPKKMISVVQILLQAPKDSIKQCWPNLIHIAEIMMLCKLCTSP